MSACLIYVHCTYDVIYLHFVFVLYFDKAVLVRTKNQTNLGISCGDSHEFFINPLFVERCNDFELNEN